jgi:hypothetical protein
MIYQLSLPRATVPKSTSQDLPVGGISQYDERSLMAKMGVIVIESGARR